MIRTTIRSIVRERAKEGALQSAGDLSEVVIDQWRQRIRISTFANYHYEMGLVLARADDKVHAIGHLRKAAGLMSDHAAARFELEALLLSTGQNPADTERLDPELRFKGFVEHVARALADGRLDDAEKDLSTAPDPGKNGAVVSWLQVLMLLAKGEACDKPDEPLTEAMVSLMRPVGNFLLATAQKCQVTLNPAALDCFRLYMALEPDSSVAMQGLATALLVNGHHDELRAHIGKLPITDTQSFLHRGFIWIGLDEAEKVLAEQDLMQEERLHCMSLILRACALLLLDRREEAEPLIRQAEELGTNPNWIIVVRAWYEAGGGRPVRADVSVPGVRFALARLPARISALLDLQ